MTSSDILKSNECDVKQLQRMTSKMEELRYQHSSTDIIIQCKDGDIYAHKFVLIASSKYFEKMLTTDMLEKNSGKISFKYLEKNLVDIIIKYLYMGELPNVKGNYDFNFLVDLIKTCHMMEVQDLLKHCWLQATEKVELEQFCSLWSLRVDLKLQTIGTIESIGNMQRIIQNLTKQILELESTHHFSEEQLKEFLECIDKNKFCKEIVTCICKWGEFNSKESTVALLESINLKPLNSAALREILQSLRSNRKRESIESVLVDEAIQRL